VYSLAGCLLNSMRSGFSFSICCPPMCAKPWGSNDGAVVVALLLQTSHPSVANESIYNLGVKDAMLFAVLVYLNEFVVNEFLRTGSCSS
jgi:hypothetical protein